MTFGHRHGWCPHAHSALDVSDSCVRDAWSSVVPASIVFALILLSLFNRTVKTAILPESIKRLFRPFLTIEEAEALDGGGEISASSKAAIPSLWRTVLFAGSGILQTLIWLGLASYHFYTDPAKHRIAGGIFPLLTAFAWLYTGLRPIIKPSVTPMYDLLVVYSTLLCGGCLKLGGALVHSHWATVDWIAAWLNLGMVLLVLTGLAGMPLNVPSEKIEGEIVSLNLARVV